MSTGVAKKYDMAGDGKGRGGAVYRGARAIRQDRNEAGGRCLGFWLSMPMSMVMSRSVRAVVLMVIEARR